jgi:hypothetical protein
VGEAHNQPAKAFDTKGNIHPTRAVPFALGAQLPQCVAYFIRKRTRKITGYAMGNGHRQSKPRTRALRRSLGKMHDAFEGIDASCNAIQLSAEVSKDP